MVRLASTQLLLISALAPLLAVAQEVSCFAPDGKTLGNNETYVPCNKLGITQKGIFSSCCRLDGKASERDLCTSNGLCLNQGVLTRGYCTDKDWKSDACVKVCMNDENNGSSNDTVEITPCTDGKYCCGKNNLNCCGTEDAFEIHNLVEESGASATQSAEVVTETATVTPATFKNATIGLAVVLGAVILAAAGALFFLSRKNKVLYQQLQQTTPPMEQQQQHQQQGHNLSPSQPDHVNAYVQSYNPGSTVAGSTTSPYMGYSQQHKTEPPQSEPPLSPGLSEAPTHQRYSELDATAAVKNDLASPTPSYYPGTVPEEEAFTVRSRTPATLDYDQPLVSPPLPLQPHSQNQNQNHSNQQ